MATKVEFTATSGIDISTLLPNLPRPSDDYLITDPSAVLDLISSFLIYEPSRRSSAADGMRHAWFDAEQTILLPEGCAEEAPGVILVVDGQTLGDLMEQAGLTP